MATRGNTSTPGNPVRSQSNLAAAKGSKKVNAPAIAQKRKQFPAPVYVDSAFAHVMVPGSVEPSGEASPAKKPNSWDLGPPQMGFNPLPVASARRPIHIRVTVFSGCDTR